tara:strand:+ start:585 stop:1016 length:432 start_codon:yes stop_codon:yes gene_type:complete
MIKDLIITPLQIIDTPGGCVMHAMKDSDPGYVNFGEAYFSEIKSLEIKAWKRHKDMTLNILVPLGRIRFVLYDDRDNKNCVFQELVISKSNYCRLTIPPMIWVGFQGLSSSESILLNIADIKHDPEEIDKKNMKEIEFNWSNE